MDRATLYYPSHEQVRFSEVTLGDSGPFSHFFGGPANHRGAVPVGGVKPLHLLFSFDLRDPSLQIRLPGISVLPLYYPFRYCPSTCYRVTSDQSIELIEHEWAPLEDYSWDPEYPYTDYPESFPRCSVHVAPPTTLKLDAELLARMKEQFELDDSDDDLPEWTTNDVINAHQGFLPQDLEPSECPDCPEQEMSLLFVLHCWDSVNGVNLWSAEGKSYVTHIFYEICPRCNAILGSNQC